MSQIICLELLIAIVIIIIVNTIITIIITGPLVPLGLKPFPCRCFSTQPRIYSKFLEETKALFKKNRFFSHTLHPDHSFLSLHSYPSPSLPWSQIHSCSISLQKEAGLQETTTKPNKTWYNKTRQNPSNRGWPRLPSRRKSPKISQGVRDISSLAIKIPTNIPS